MYTSLRNQIIALSQGTNSSQCGYAINLITGKKEYSGLLFPTPDAALKWCYDDAHKRKLPYIHVMLMMAFRWDKGNCEYVSDRVMIHGFSAERSSLKMIIHDDVKNNLIWSMDDTGVCGRDTRPECMKYPAEKPQYEMLDYIRWKDHDWHTNTAHMSVAEYEHKHGRSSPTRDLEDLYALVTGTRPPNSLPINKFTCDICKAFDIAGSRVQQRDNLSVHELTDDELMAITKKM